MPFNTLLLSGCFLPGKTSFIENGVEISLQPEAERHQLCNPQIHSYRCDDLL